MCGIVGVLDLREGRRPIDAALLARMNDSLTHRGPDGSGYHREPGLGLGHRRLSIIDLEGGRQPLYNEDESVVVTYNGEIYNFRELADELMAAGHRFRTHCDTEVIVHAWEEWGEACVDRFIGMFAFALWDRNRRSLFLVRDRLGIKPLYYAETPDGFLIFGSELKALQPFPSLVRDIDSRSVEDYFTFGYIPDPRTIYRGTHKLPPGHCLIVRPGSTAPSPRRYWDVEFPGQRQTSVGDGELVERLSAAVKRRLISDVPIGAFLSGGVDSSAVVACMAKLMSEPVKTCSISFGDPRFNEAAYAQQIADKFGTDHDVFEVNPDELNLLDTLAQAYDEPYADSSSIPTYRVCELARRKVTVALSGDGGDEVFAGYRRYKWHMLEEAFRSRLPAPLRAGLFGLLGAVYPKADWAPKVLRAKSTFQAIARDTLDAYLHTVSIATAAQRRELFSADLQRDLQGYRSLEVFQKHAADAPRDDALGLVQYLDFKTYLPGDILTKVDRASMAHSLEVRVPILDHEFVNWAAQLSPEQKLKGGEGKWVFKHALEPILPESILYRPKMGFAVPLASWFRGPLSPRMQAAVAHGPLAISGLFDNAVLQRLVRQHESAQRNHSAVLWALLMFDSFLSREGVAAGTT